MLDKNGVGVANIQSPTVTGIIYQFEIRPQLVGFLSVCVCVYVYRLDTKWLASNLDKAMFRNIECQK